MPDRCGCRCLQFSGQQSQCVCCSQLLPSRGEDRAPGFLLTTKSGSQPVAPAPTVALSHLLPGLSWPDLLQLLQLPLLLLGGDSAAQQLIAKLQQHHALSSGQGQHHNEALPADSQSAPLSGLQELTARAVGELLACELRQATDAAAEAAGPLVETATPTANADPDAGGSSQAKASADTSQHADQPPGQVSDF